MVISAKEYSEVYAVLKMMVKIKQKRIKIVLWNIKKTFGQE